MCIRDRNIEVGSLWLVIGGASMLLAWWLAYRDMKLSGWIMLGLEGAAVTGIIALCIRIVQQLSLIHI